MKGFKVTCLDCGKEQIIKSGDVIVSDLEEVEVYPVQSNVVIECDCGNDSDIGYW